MNNSFRKNALNTDISRCSINSKKELSKSIEESNERPFLAIIKKPKISEAYEEPRKPLIVPSPQFTESFTLTKPSTKNSSGF